jgi:hypothetical protein
MLLLAGCSGFKHVAAPTSYAFDGAYEVKEAEARLNERILNKEMAAERPGGRGGEDGLKTTRCVVSPPPPAAHRMLCTVVTFAKEVRQRISVTHYYRRTATIAARPAQWRANHPYQPPVG